MGAAQRAGNDGDGLEDQWLRAWERRGWAGSAASVAVVLALFEAHRGLTNRIDRALRPVGLTFARFEVLTHLLLADGRPQHVTGLASALQVHPTSISSALDRLEADGLAVRLGDESDHRRVLARLTPLGRSRARRAATVLRASVLTDLGLSADETATLLRVLGSLRANAGDFVPDGARPHARSA